MKELYEKGVATHLGPEPCGGRRKATTEASVGVRAGRAIEPRKCVAQGADAVVPAEGNRSAGATASRSTTLRGQRPRHARKLIAREPGDPTNGHGDDGAAVRPGNPEGASQG